MVKITDDMVRQKISNDYAAGLHRKNGKCKLCDKYAENLDEYCEDHDAPWSHIWKTLLFFIIIGFIDRLIA